AKTQAATRGLHERALAPRPAADPNAEAAWGELVSVLDEELARLPEKYRAPLVLCYLEGKTQDEAVRRLGWAKITFRRRLEQGRDRRGSRWPRRGLTLSAALLPAVLTQSAPAAVASVALVDATVEAALAFGMGEVAVGALSIKAAILAQGALKAMSIV